MENRIKSSSPRIYKKYFKYILEICMMNDYNSLEDFNIVRDTMKAGNYYMFFHKVHPIVSTYGVFVYIGGCYGKVKNVIS